MKNYFNSFLLVLVGLVLFSCASSSLADNSIVKKRRYKKGWHIDLGNRNVNTLTKSAGGNPFSLPELLDSSSKETPEVPVVETTAEEVVSVDSTEVTSESALKTAAEPNVAEMELSEEKKCDTIVFNDGKRILAVIGKVSKKEVTYKLCDNPDGPEFSHKTSLIKKLQFGIGTETVIKDYYTFDDSDEEEPKDEKKKVEVLSLLSLIFFGLSLLLVTTGAWLLTLPASLILGIVGLFRIKRFKEKFKGRWMALTGVIGSSIGILAVVAAILILIAAFSGGGGY